MRRVWRTFFKSVPFAGARAEVTRAIWAGAGFEAVGYFESRRLVQARQRGRKPPAGLMPSGCTGASSPSVAPAHTRVRQFDFSCLFRPEWTVREQIAFVIS